MALRCETHSKSFCQLQGKRAVPLETGPTGEAPAAVGGRHGRVPAADGGGPALESGRGGGGRFEFTAVLLRHGPRTCAQCLSVVVKMTHGLGLMDKLLCESHNVIYRNIAVDPMYHPSK